MISIVIPTYNNLDYLKLCLKSLKQNSNFDHEIILHINDGSDGTLDFAINNNYKHTSSETNIGLCSAINKAAKLVSNKYILYSHDDMYFCPEWDRVLLDEVNKLNAIADHLFKNEQMKAKQKSPLGLQKLIKNDYLNNNVNKKNLIFIFNICNFLKINLKKIIPTLNKFKGLRFRNEIVINGKKIKVINDSKSTSFSSTQELIDTKKKTFWILGGLPKKGDKFTLSKKCCLNLNYFCTNFYMNYYRLNI